MSPVMQNCNKLFQTRQFFLRSANPSAPGIRTEPQMLGKSGDGPVIQYLVQSWQVKHFTVLEHKAIKLELYSDFLSKGFTCVSSQIISTIQVKQSGAGSPYCICNARRCKDGRTKMQRGVGSSFFINDNQQQNKSNQRNIQPRKAQKQQYKNKIPQTTGGKRLPKYDPQSETTIYSCL